MDINRYVYSLHKYFIWADRMRHHFDKNLEAGYDKKNKRQRFDLVLYLSYWYAALYVVVEGWQDLGLHDPRIDKLLESKNLNLLKRFRNAVFHFQRIYFNDRCLEFISEGEKCVDWIRGLNSEFSRFFLSWATTSFEFDPRNCKT